MPVPAPVTRATLCDAAIGSSSNFVALSTLHLLGRNAVVLRTRRMPGSGRMTRRRVLRLGLAALSAPLLTSPWARAQTRYPERPIRLIIPFPPGGVNDAIGRPWADKMKALLGTIVIENMGGAGGTVGALAVARAQPDGYTLLLGSGGTQVIIPIASSQPSYDPAKAFEPIALLGVTAVCIAVHPSVPVQTLGELVAYA